MNPLERPVRTHVIQTKNETHKIHEILLFTQFLNMQICISVNHSNSFQDKGDKNIISRKEKKKLHLDKIMTPNLKIFTRCV